MKFSEYMINKFNNGDSRSVLLWGEGGLGKTYSLLDLYENLNKEDFYFDSKTLVPLYVPLNEFFVSGISNEDSSFIRKYIWSQYTSQIIDENTVNNLDNKILNVLGSTYHFVLLCDGLNECANAGMLFSEINTLATYTNVTVCLTSRTKLNDFEHFDYIELCPLSIEQVRSIIAHHCNDLSTNESLVSLLQIPFYLNLWLGLPDSQKNEQYTKSKLLEKYIKNLLCNQKKNNSATEKIKLADDFKLDYSTAIDYVEKFLWALSWVSEKNKTMVASVGDELWESAKELYTEEMYRSAQITRLREELFDDFLIPLGLFKKAKKDSYTYTHQIYRDFFAAQYLHCKEFERFEHKISKNNISEAVIELFGGLFVDADEDLYSFAHKINARISENEKLKKNTMVNRNIVRLFREASCTIENEDFSNRDLTMCDFAMFDKILYSNFENADCSQLSFSFGTGEIFTGEALTLTDELILIRGLNALLIINVKNGRIEQSIEHMTIGYMRSLCAGMVSGDLYIAYISFEIIVLYNVNKKEFSFFSSGSLGCGNFEEEAKLFIVDNTLSLFCNKILCIIENLNEEKCIKFIDQIACWVQDGELFSQSANGDIINHTQKLAGSFEIVDEEAIYYCNTVSRGVIVTQTSVISIHTETKEHIVYLDNSMVFQEAMKIGTVLYLYASNIHTVDMEAMLLSNCLNYETLESNGFKEKYVAIELENLSVTILDEFIVKETPFLFYANISPDGKWIYKHLENCGDDIYLFNPFQKEYTIIRYDKSLGFKTISRVPFSGRMLCQINDSEFLTSVLGEGFFITKANSRSPFFYDKTPPFGTFYYNEQSNILQIGCHANNLKIFSYALQANGLRLIGVENISCTDDFIWKSDRFLEFENNTLYDLHTKNSYVLFEDIDKSANISRIYDKILLTSQYDFQSNYAKVFAYKFNDESGHWDFMDGKYISECFNILLADNYPMAIGMCDGEDRIFVLTFENSKLDVTYINLSELHNFDEKDLFCNSEKSFLISYENALVWCDDNYLYVLNSLSGSKTLLNDAKNNLSIWLRWDELRKVVLCIEAKTGETVDDLFVPEYYVYQIKVETHSIKREPLFSIKCNRSSDVDIEDAWFLENGLMINFGNHIVTYDKFGNLKFDSYLYHVELKGSKFSKNTFSYSEENIVIQNGGIIL